MRAAAEETAKAARDKALSDNEFRELRAELTAATCSADIDRVVPRYVARLDLLGIKEKDFEPQYNCLLCADTGQNLDTGQRCLCRARVKQMIIDSKFKA